MLSCPNAEGLHCQRKVGTPALGKSKVKFFLPLLKFMKRPQTKLHTHTMRDSQVTIGQKKSKFIIKSKYIVRANLSCGTFFLFIDILLKLQQQILIHFCKSSCNSVIIVCWL